MALDLVEHLSMKGIACMFMSRLTVFELPHCPPGQLSVMGGGASAGLDIMAAEDKLIYPPSMIMENEGLGLSQWRLVGNLDGNLASLNPEIYAQVQGLLELGSSLSKVGFKVSASGDVYQLEFKPQLISTGVVVRYDDDASWSLVTTRSSVGGKQLLSMPHGVGVIDPDYCGPEDELFISFTSDTLRLVRKGDRIAQLIPMVKSRVVMEKVSSEDETFRNMSSRGGFGSTGLN